ncbi:MAG: hypothetical protein ABIG40_00795 [Parcubacteria group bacterium]
MFIFIIFFIIIVAVVGMFAGVYARARKVRQKHVDEAEKRGDMKEAKRFKNMSEDEIADEFEDELHK